MTDKIRKFVATIEGALVSGADEDTFHMELLERLGMKEGRTRDHDEVAFGYLTPDRETLHLEVGTLPEGMTHSSLLRSLSAELPGYEVISAAGPDRWKFE